MSTQEPEENSSKKKMNRITGATPLCFLRSEDKHHFVFDCPAIRNRFTNLAWGPAPTLSSLFTKKFFTWAQSHICWLLRECFEHTNTPGLVAAQSGYTLYSLLQLEVRQL